MSRRLRVIMLLLVLGTVPGALRAQRAARDADAASARAAMHGFMDALNALDADRMATFFADDITAFVPSAQADRVNGKAAVDRIFQAFVARARPTTPRLTLVPEDLTVEAMRDLAVVTFNIRDAAATRRRTFVWRRTGERWLIAHFHASDFVTPPAGP